MGLRLSRHGPALSEAQLIVLVIRLQEVYALLHVLERRARALLGHLRLEDDTFIT
jgi:hypothetical protein